MIALVFVVSVAHAQTSTRFTTVLTSPTNNSTHNNGTTMIQEATVTVAAGAIVPGDTIAFGDPITLSNTPPTVYIRTGITKAMGDTLQFNYTYNGLSANAGTNNYCVRAFLFNAGTFATGFDTTGYRSCNSVTFVGAPAGVNQIVFEKGIATQKVKIFPNPATADNINFDYVAQNASDVEVNVYDLTGRKVMSHSFGKAFKGQEGFSLDISSINKGMYILELRQDGIKATGQFMK